MRFVPSEKICPFFSFYSLQRRKKIPLLNKYRPAYLCALGGGRMDAHRTRNKTT